MAYYEDVILDDVIADYENCGWFAVCSGDKAFSGAVVFYGVETDHV